MQGTYTERAGYRCQSCDSPFHKDTPRHCPVEQFVAFAKTLRCPTCNSSKITIGLSLSRQENDALKISGSQARRAQNWLDTGETGSSSLAIFEVLHRGKVDHKSHPLDIADLRRCLFLFDHVPEWRTRITELAVLSPEWARLSASWREITDLYASETGDGGRSAPQTAALLETILYHGQR